MPTDDHERSRRDYPSLGSLDHAFAMLLDEQRTQRQAIERVGRDFSSFCQQNGREAEKMQAELRELRDAVEKLDGMRDEVDEKIKEATKPQPTPAWVGWGLGIVGTLVAAGIIGLVSMYADVAVLKARQDYVFGTEWQPPARR